MIKVNIKRNKHHIFEFKVEGHANSIKNIDKLDLVCAGVSAVVYGILNSLKTKYLNIKIDDGYLLIEVKEFFQENDLTLNILKTSLKTIEEEYKENIFINEEVL